MSFWGDRRTMKGQIANRNKDKHEISKGSFSISKKVLGSGSHGNVLLGKVNGNQVAVKISSNVKGKEGICGLLSEIKILAYLEKHENIIELVGVNTLGLRREKVFVFLEFCGLGSLESFLKAKANNEDAKENEIELRDTELPQKLMQWSFEIATGMEYIASKQIVHMDLATRNILLTHYEQVKISDFCLSQYLSGTYVVTNEDALPWRWMAPECFNNFAFNQQSDVWAFGVTLWEIFSLADVPYGGGQYYSEEFTTGLSRGLRLSAPLYNQDGVYEVMKSCWLRKPEERPGFAELRLVLEGMMKVKEKNSDEKIYDVL